MQQNILSHTPTKGGLFNENFRITRAQKRAHLNTFNACHELYGIINHFFPDLIPLLSKVNDPRHQNYTTYDSETLLLIRVLAAVFHIGSMRKMTEYFNSDVCIDNMGYILKCDEISELPHWSTVNDYLERLDPKELEKVIKALVTHLLRMRSFEDSRIRNKYWQVIVDGTWLCSFKERHCPNCLTKKHKDKSGNITWVEYYHYVVEAKLVLFDNIVVSIATEFVENETADVNKQDCELRAFYRLSEKLKQNYPRLPICLTLDSLYAGGPVFDICKGNGWRYIVRFKDGSIPTLAEDFHALKWYIADQGKVETEDGVMKAYKYVTDIEYQKHKLNVVEYEQSDLKYPFIFVTDMAITKRNYEGLVRDGRRRWKIENEGFNIQKRHGYELEHLYSENYNGMKNHYLLIQVGHTISQILERGIDIWVLIKSPLYKIIDKIKQGFESTKLRGSKEMEIVVRRRYRFN